MTNALAKREIRYVQSDELRPHPLNARVYGKEVLEPDFVESIRVNGIYEPVVVVADGKAFVILSGHRRAAAAKRVHRTIPIRVVDDAGALWQESYLLEANRQRRKTEVQLMREAAEMLRIDSALAAEREKAGVKVDPSVKSHKGRATAIVGKKIGKGEQWVNKATAIVRKAAEGNAAAIEGLKKIEHKEKGGTVNAVHNSLVPAKKATPIATVSAGDMHDYIHNFLTREEADRLFAFCQTLPAKRLVNPRNPAVNIRKLQMPCYSVATNFRTVPNGYPGEDITGWTEPGMKLSPNERTNEWMTPLEDAPAEIQALREKLSKFAGKDVNYLSLVGYADEKDHITWHRHREDDGRDATVYLISLGATRTFGLRPKDAPRDQWTSMQPVHGSLIVIPSEYNDTHEHAVLDDKEPKGLRISINTKCIPLEDIEEHARRKATNFAAQARKATERAALPAKRAPQIFDCHAGKKYPADAVYVGRLTRDRGGRILRPDTPFGNHNKRALDTEVGRAAWAADVAERMKDPAFVAQLQALRGKDLLCWCKAGEPNCHARTWLELANK